jgi:hypothetical protein
MVSHILRTSNGLGGNNNFLYRYKDRYAFSSLNTIYELSKRLEIHLPTVDHKGNQVWVKIERLQLLGEGVTQKVIPTNGLYMTSMLSQRLPIYVNVNQKHHNSYLRINFKQIKQLVRHDKLWFFTNMNIDLDQGGRNEYRKGFFIGFFIAEGNFIYYKHVIKQDSVFSRSALKRWSKNKGYRSIDDYMKERKDIKIKGLQLVCGVKDIERGYLEMLPFRINVNQYKNTIHVSIYDKDAINLVKKYVEGSISKDKHLKSTAFNSSKQFLKGALDGFIAGDGHREKTRISIGMTSNYILRDQLMFMSKLYGMQPRYSETFAYATKDKKKRYHVLILKIYSFNNRIIRNNIIFQQLRRIEEYKTEKIYELEVESQASISDEWNKIVVMGNGLVIQTKE